MTLRGLVCLVFLFAAVTGTAQTNNANKNYTNKGGSGTDVFLTMDQFFAPSDTGESAKLSIEESVGQMMANMESRRTVRNVQITSLTDALNAIAIEETPEPETNQNIIESVDPKTKRYPPRLFVDFRIFPLQRTTTKLGSPKISADSLKRNIERRLGVHDVHFSLQNRVMTLTGTVPGEHERQMVELMVRLEPGVDQIENELVIKLVPNDRESERVKE